MEKYDVNTSPTKQPPLPSVEEPLVYAEQKGWRRLLDKAAWGLALGGVLLTMAILLTIFAVLIHGSWMALGQIGWHFFTTQAWNPVPGRDQYGVLAFLYGTPCII